MNQALLDTIYHPQDIRKLSLDELQTLADEVRDELITVASKLGGHLGAGLGVVELTIALHYVFNTPQDLLIWDVGHQAYPHKVLTGRKELLRTIRQPNGISGFTKRSESIYDPFGAGHSSTSISAALGMSVARDLQQKEHDVIAVIGDGAISAGMAYEALNNAGHHHNRLIVILNDNEMSIAPAVGAMSRYLSRIISSKPYFNMRNLAKDMLKRMPLGLEKIAQKTEKYAKNLATDNNFFEELGFYYIGPVDGHDIKQLVPILSNIKQNTNITKPVLIHVKTEKGKGFICPEKSLESYHAVLPFDLETKIQKKPATQPLTYTKVFSTALITIAKQDTAVVSITAAMPSGTGLDAFEREFPDRMFDVGIAEQHAVTFAGGLATQGIKPFVAIYSTFLQRAYDQIVHDIAIQHLPVRFIIDRAGLVGADGPTHAGSFDLAYLCNLPDFIVMVPSSGLELSRMVATAYSINDRPSAIRFPRANAIEFEDKHALIPLEIGKGVMMRHGQDIAVLALGTRLEEAIKAADLMVREERNITVVDARFAKPLDTELIERLAKSHRILITVEEGVIGGFGSHVAQYLIKAGLLDDHQLRFRSLFLPDMFIEHNIPHEMYEQAGLNASGIIAIIKSLL